MLLKVLYNFSKLGGKVLFHNSTKKIRGQYSNVDNLIASIIKKNKESKNIFRKIVIHLEPVITRFNIFC